MDLSKAISNTLAYFDLFDYPLTATEVWQFLFLPRHEPVSFDAIAIMLVDLRTNKKIGFQNGFYVLSGRETLIQTRRERHRLSIQKMRLAHREARRLMCLPSVRGVAISNSLSLRNSRVGGDIDFFIITSDSTVWRTRGLAAGYAELFNKRPRENYKQDQLCLCFFTAEHALNLEACLLPAEQGIPDMVRIYWQATLQPLAGDEQMWKNFYAANQWVTTFLPNLQYKYHGMKETNQSIAPSLFEKLAARIQKKILPLALKGINQDGEVVTTFQMIKLHQNNDRREIRQRFKEKYQSV